MYVPSKQSFVLFKAFITLSTCMISDANRRLSQDARPVRETNGRHIRIFPELFRHCSGF